MKKDRVPGEKSAREKDLVEGLKGLKSTPSPQNLKKQCLALSGSIVLICLRKSLWAIGSPWCKPLYILLLCVLLTSVVQCAHYFSGVECDLGLM
jgi:hypothetical protein